MADPVIREAYSAASVSKLLKERQIVAIEIDPKDMKKDESYLVWFSDIKAWRGPVEYRPDIGWRCENHDIPSMWGPATSAVSISKLPAPQEKS